MAFFTWLNNWREWHLLHLGKRSYIVIGSTILTGALVAGAANIGDRPDPVTVPQHTAIEVTLNEALSSNRSNPGDRFDARVAEPVVIDGKLAVPEGAMVEGRVVDADESGRLRGRARLYLTLETIQVNGKTYDLHTLNSDRTGGAHKKRNWWLIGGGGGGGALIGALAGGGKGALIGGPVGAGAGTAVAYFTGKKDIHLPAETRLTFRLADPLTVDVRGMKQKPLNS
jgi:hypothetical protein